MLLLAVFGIGAVLSLAAFATLLDHLLRDHHDTVISALVGLMAGSLRVLWPWPDLRHRPSGRSPSVNGWYPLLLAVVGFAVVLGVGFAAGASRTPGGPGPGSVNQAGE